MKKLAYVIAAISAFAIAAPSIANAETVVIKHRDHMRGEMHRDWHRDHGWRHHDHDRTVIIKHRHHES